MPLSFILLVAASLIFRYLGSRAHFAFNAKVAALLPRNVASDRTKTLFAEFSERIPEFRAQALPLRTGQLALDTLSCLTFLAGLWICPPLFIKGFELSLLRYSGMAVVASAFLMDCFAVLRLARAASTPASEPTFPE